MEANNVGICILSALLIALLSLLIKMIYKKQKNIRETFESSL